MENKKYLDKVLDHLVRSTKINYENNEVNTPIPHLFPSYFHFPFTPPSTFTKYCKDQFGLTEEEMEYVWKEYVDIINDKIEDEE